MTLENLPKEILSTLQKKNRNWAEFGLCWEWAQKQKWWGDFDEFVENNLTDLTNDAKILHAYPWIIRPDRFAGAVYTYLKGR